MTEAEVKEAVRERDGFKCHDCGMTQEEHVGKTGRDLDVHRVIPGFDYVAYWCVTLCRSCHGKKAKTVSDSVWREDEARWFALNLYCDDIKELVSRLDRYASSLGVSWENALLRLIDEGLRPVEERDRADLLMQADGVW